MSLSERFRFPSVAQSNDEKGVSGQNVNNQALESFLDRLATCINSLESRIAALEQNPGGGGGASAFLDLTDTPGAYGGANQQVTVNGSNDGLTFTPAITPGATAFLGLTDTPGAFGTAGQLAAVNGTTDALEFVDAPSGGGFTYSTTEFDTGLVWTDGKPVYGRVYDIGTVVTDTNQTIAHGITALDNVIYYQGAIVDTAGNHYPLPHLGKTSSALGEFIGIEVDGTNITLVVDGTFSNSPDGQIVLFYTRTPVVPITDPSDISGIKTHWDFDDSGSLSTSGSTINSITNQVGGASTLVQRGTNPLPVTTTFNSRTWADLTGAGNVCMHVADPAASDVLFGTGSFTFAATFTTSTALTIRQALFGKGQFDRYIVFIPRESTADIQALIDSGTNQIQVNTGTGLDALDGAAHTVIVTGNRTNAGADMDIEIFFDGVSEATGTITSLGTLDDTSGTIQSFILGAISSGALTIQRPFKGRIGEVVFYDNAISSLDVGRLNTFLSTKWGV
jgi:hypothetical protein